MPNFSSESLQNFFSAFSQCFSYLIGVFRSLFYVICSSPLYYVPLVMFMLLGMVFLVLFVIQEAGRYSSGSEYNTRPINYNQYANPNRYYDSKPLFGLLFNRFGYGYWKHKNDENKKQQEAALRAYEKVVEEQEKIQFQRYQDYLYDEKKIIDQMDKFEEKAFDLYEKMISQRYQDYLHDEKRIVEQMDKLDYKAADEYEKYKDYNSSSLQALQFFNNNPHARSVSISGHTFYNGDDWYKKSWGSEGKMRHTTSYQQIGIDETGKPIYKSIKQTHTVSEVEDV